MRPTLANKLTFLNKYKIGWERKKNMTSTYKDLLFIPEILVIKDKPAIFGNTISKK